MTNAEPSANPYATPATVDRDRIDCASPSNKRLWIAFGIAPPVAPLAAALTIFIAGMVYLANHPEDTGTPVGVVMLPMMLLVVGVPVAYGVAGLIGMPIAFALRKRDKLNGFTVHGTALLLAAAIASGFALVAVILSFTIQDFEGGEPPHFGELLGGALGLFVALAPFLLLSAMTFWMIGVRNSKRASDSE